LLESTSTSPDAVKADSDSYRKVQSLAAEFKSGKIPTAEDMADWGGEEWELYLENVSTDESSQVCSMLSLLLLPV
jgi:leukotriene-A4 hydrolase